MLKVKLRSFVDFDQAKLQLNIFPLIFQTYGFTCCKDKRRKEKEDDNRKICEKYSRFQILFDLREQKKNERKRSVRYF